MAGELGGVSTCSKCVRHLWLLVLSVWEVETVAEVYIESILAAVEMSRTEEDSGSWVQGLA